MFSLHGVDCLGIVISQQQVQQSLSNEKKRLATLKHCALAVVRRSQNFSPRCRPLPGGAGRPNFNQLLLQTQFGDDRCTQFRVIVVTDPQTHDHKHQHPQTNPQTGPITMHCAAAMAQYNNVNRARCAIDSVHSCIYTVVASTRRQPLTSWSGALRMSANGCPPTD